MHTPAPAAAQSIWKSQNTHLPLFKSRINPPTSDPPFVYWQYVCYCWLNRNLFGTPKDWVRLPDRELKLNFTWYIFWLLSFLFVVVTHQWSNPLRLLLIHNVVWGMWNGWMKTPTATYRLHMCSTPYSTPYSTLHSYTGSKCACNINSETVGNMHKDWVRIPAPVVGSVVQATLWLESSVLCTIDSNP